MFIAAELVNFEERAINSRIQNLRSVKPHASTKVPDGSSLPIESRQDLPGTHLRYDKDSILAGTSAEPHGHTLSGHVNNLFQRLVMTRLKQNSSKGCVP